MGPEQDRGGTGMGLRRDQVETGTGLESVSGSDRDDWTRTGTGTELVPNRYGTGVGTRRNRDATEPGCDGTGTRRDQDGRAWSSGRP